jgi:hypothetical protein
VASRPSGSERPAEARINTRLFRPLRIGAVTPIVRGGADDVELSREGCVPKRYPVALTSIVVGKRWLDAGLTEEAKSKVA